MIKKEDIVNVDLAKSLKDKNFNEVCDRGYYIEDKDITPLFYGTFSNEGEGYTPGHIAAPTLYEAQKWLREEYKIYVSTLPTKDGGKTTWYYQIAKDRFSKIILYTVGNETYKSFEEALHFGITEALKLI